MDLLDVIAGHLHQSSAVRRVLAVCPAAHVEERVQAEGPELHSGIGGDVPGQHGRDHSGLFRNRYEGLAHAGKGPAALRKICFTPSARSFQRDQDLLPWRRLHVVVPEHLGEDQAVGPAIRTSRADGNAAGGCGEGRRVDLFADTGVLNERVVDIPEHDKWHTASVSTWAVPAALPGCRKMALRQARGSGCLT